MPGAGDGRTFKTPRERHVAMKLARPGAPCSPTARRKAIPEACAWQRRACMTVFMGGSDPALFAGLRERDLAREGIALAEGRLVVERLLEAPGFEPLGIRCVPAFAERARELAAGRCELVVASEAESASLVGFPFHHGVMAAARRPPPLAPDSLLAGLGTRAGARILLLPGTSDAENLGALARSAAAFGFDAVLLGGTGADPLSRRALRVSMGATLRLPCVRLVASAELHAFRAAGFELAAAVTRGGSDPDR